MKHMMFKKIKTVNHAYRQRGASLLEGIAYLGIAAVVVIGAVALMRGAFSNAQSNGLLQDVISIRTNIRKLYMGQGGTPYAAIALGPLVNAQAFPASVATVAGPPAAATNTWGGAIAVAAAAGGSNFSITYPNVPQDVCINALTGTTGWISITVGAAAAIVQFPVAPAAASGACAAAANNITWVAS